MAQAAGCHPAGVDRSQRSIAPACAAGPTRIAIRCIGRGAQRGDVSASPPRAAVDLRGQPTLGEAFVAAGQQSANRPAVVTDDEVFTFGDLLSAARQVAHAVAACDGFGAGDRVVLLIENSFEYAAGFYGVILARGVAVPLSPQTPAATVDHVCESCEAKALLGSPAYLRQRGNADQIAHRLDWRAGGGEQPSIETLAPAAAGCDDLTAIFFTSGSSGEPKGVMLSHRNLLSNAASICDYLAIDHRERALGLLPFQHAFGNSVMQSHVLSGATLVLAGDAAFPNTVVDAIAGHDVTSLSAPPQMFEYLLARSKLGATPLPSLRYMAVAGGALPSESAAALAQRIAPAELFVMYGQTEATARLSYLPPKLLRERAGSIGKGMPGVTFQVVDEQGDEVTPGEIGQIRAAGPNIMLGYWCDPIGTAEVLRDGWLYTGDLATVDGDGFVYVRGRSNALIKVNGYRFHPGEVERMVMRLLPHVTAVAVAYEAGGVGTRLALFIEPRDATTKVDCDQIHRICRRELPPHQQPAVVEVMSPLPHNQAMKVDRAALARRAAQLGDAMLSGEC